ncbi:MAG TPA: purine-nucleoside phosphorylase [Vicinamibacterales bacterium]|nr:purine-nucleoside phosphorylase [Vicinamibacterales bacterium]
MSFYDQVREAADAVQARVDETPIAAIVLGSGLGEFANRLADAVSLRYSDLPHWPVSRVVGHEGRLVVGRIGHSNGKRAVVLSGRSHLYEGHSAQTVTFGVRVLGLLGVKTIVLTNAAGGVNTTFSEGALMVIDDHINLMGANPLAGPNDDRFGPRFPDMTEVYSLDLRGVADRAARANNLRLAHGVYAALLGPSYETPAEIRYLRAIGADAVGMSTVPEAIAARHMGMKVLGISCITNMAAGVLPGPLNHEDVLATTRRVRGQFMALLEGILEGIPEGVDARL